MAKYSNIDTHKLLIILTVLQIVFSESSGAGSNSTTDTVTNRLFEEVSTSDTQFDNFSSWRINRTDPTIYAETYTFPTIVLTYPKKKKLYTWNKAELSSLTFQQSYCPKRCKADRVVFIYSVDDSCKDIICFNCQCDRPLCELYGICCPDISEPAFLPPDSNGDVEIMDWQIYSSWGNGRSLQTTFAPIDLATTDVTFQEFDVNEPLNEELNGSNNYARYKEREEKRPSTEVQPSTKGQHFTEGQHFTKGQQLFSEELELPEEQRPIDRRLVADEQRFSEEPPRLPDEQRFSEEQSQLPEERKPSEERGLPLKDDSRHLKLECEAETHALYIRSCSPDVKVSPDVVVKCETGLAVEEITADSLAMVIDNNTQLVYHNRFCADCNGVEQYLQWQVYLRCVNYMHVYSATTLDDLIRLSYRPLSKCDTYQIPPTGFLIIPCEDGWFSSKVVDTCNVTGLWRDYDEDVVTSCASLKGLIYKVARQRTPEEGGDQFFQNIFCAICNQENYPVYIMGCRDTKSGPKYAQGRGSPLSMLFNVRKEPSDSEVTNLATICADSQWKAPNGTCLPVNCPPGKLLNNSICSTPLDIITGLGYRLQLWLLPRLDNASAGIYTVPSSTALRRFYRKLLYIMRPLVQGVDLTLGVAGNISSMSYLPETLETFLGATTTSYYTYDSSTVTAIAVTPTTTEEQPEPVLQAPFLYWVTGLLIAKSTIKRDEFEEAITDNLLNSDVHVVFAEDVAVNFTSSVMLQDLDTSEYCTQIEKTNPDIACYNSTYKVYRISPFYLNDTDLFLNITNVLICSFVSFQELQYEIEVSIKDIQPMYVVKLDLGKIKLTFRGNYELRNLAVDKNGTLNVCLDILNEKLSQIGEIEVAAELIQIVLYYLTLACFGVSMACLLLTVVTYALFPVLRSVGGRNNMCLSGSLLLAQTCLLASYHTETDSAVCIPLGVATHFLWLSMFSWSFICCFYMYRVFGAKTRSSYTTSRSQAALMVKNVTFSLLAPAIIVVAVIVANYVTSGGEDVGYGVTACYLNAPRLVGAAMVGPLIVVLTCNTVFFVITVCNIHAVRKLQTQDTSKKDDHQNIYVYAKLSTMTGALWFTTIIAEISNLDSLRVITILLNGLQGVFIFLSYVCNKRVLNLYLDIMGFKKPLHSFTSSTTERSILGRHSPKKDDKIGLKTRDASIYSVTESNSIILENTKTKCHDA